MPPTQRFGMAHALKQPPQWFGLLEVSTHSMPHNVPVGQNGMHRAFAQRASAGHVKPQPPQFDGSLFRSTQRSKQGDRFAGQPQDPERHAASPRGSQTLPHAPQLKGSVVMSTQTPSQTPTNGP
jgi:hypothetical protein